MSEVLTKICSKCEVEKELSAFNNLKKSSDGKKPSCRECQAIYRKEYYSKNREKELQMHKEYCKDNREKVKKMRADRWKVYGPTQKKEKAEYDRQYRLENKNKIQVRQAGHRSKKRKATPKWLSKEQKQYMEKFYSHCQVLEQITGNKFHVDHIVPLNGKNVSGLNVPWNLQVLPASENHKKSNKLIEEKV